MTKFLLRGGVFFAILFFMLLTLVGLGAAGNPHEVSKPDSISFASSTPLTIAGAGTSLKVTGIVTCYPFAGYDTTNTTATVYVMQNNHYNTGNVALTCDGDTHTIDGQIPDNNGLFVPGAASISSYTTMVFTNSSTHVQEVKSTYEPMSSVTLTFPVAAIAPSTNVAQVNFKTSKTPLSGGGGVDIWYNGKSGLALDVAGGSKKAGAPVVQWPYHGGTNQQWTTIDAGTTPAGYPIVYFVNINSGLVLDVAGGGKNNGAKVIQWPNHHGANQRWAFVPFTPISLGADWQFVNVNSGLVMDVSGASTKAGAPVIQWTNHHGLNQGWQI